MNLVTRWLLFRCQLESVYGSVLDHWFESHLDSPLIVGNESAEYFLDSAPFTSFLKDLEVKSGANPRECGQRSWEVRAEVEGGVDWREVRNTVRLPEG